MACLHDADDRASAIGEVLDGADYVGGVEEGLRLRGEQHVGAHERERRVRDPGDGEPHGDVAGGAEEGASEEYEPGAAPSRGRPCGEEAREDAGVGADVLEEGDGVERGLVVALGGLERRRVDAEAVGAPGAALDERAGGQRRPARPRPWRRHRRRPDLPDWMVGSVSSFFSVIIGKNWNRKGIGIVSSFRRLLSGCDSFSFRLRMCRRHPSPLPAWLPRIGRHHVHVSDFPDTRQPTQNVGGFTSFLRSKILFDFIFLNIYLDTYALKN